MSVTETATMKVIRVHHPGGPEVLRIEGILVPAPRPGWVPQWKQPEGAMRP